MNTVSVENVELGELVQIIGGGTPSRDRLDYYGGSIPWVTVKDLGDAATVRTAKEFITETGLASSATNLVPAGNVLIATRIAVGKAVFNEVPVAINQDMKALICNKKSNAKYLLYFLKSRQNFLESQGEGATVKGITLDIVRALPVPLPSPEEQKRIAAVLEKADRLRQTRRYAQTLSDTFLQSVFMEMFGDPITNLMGWDIAPLKELGNVVTGGTPSSSEVGMFGGDVPFVTPGDLDVSPMTTQRTVTKEGAMRSRTIRAGSTLVCCIGATIGKVNKTRFQSAFNQQINAVEWHESINDEYGCCVMKAISSVIARRGSSTTLPILIKSEFETITIPVPPISRQEKFASIVRQHERLRGQQAEATRQAEHLFQSLLAQSFGT